MKDEKVKKLVFAGKVNGKSVRGSWLVSQRPSNAQRIAERLAGAKISFFRFVIKNIN